MDAIDEAQSRYLAVPRKLDAELERRARGDRGCLFDLLSLGGILGMFAALIASQMGLIAFSWTYVGVAVWVGSYFVGLTRQSRSGKARQAALEAGPFALGTVIRCTPHLTEAGNRRAGRAVVVYSLDEQVRTERTALGGLASALARVPAPGASTDCAPVGPSRMEANERQRLARLLHDEFAFDTVALGGDDGDEIAGVRIPPRSHVTRVSVVGRADAPLRVGAVLPMIVEPQQNFAESL